MAKFRAAGRPARSAAKVASDDATVWLKVRVSAKVYRQLVALAKYRGVSPGSLVEADLVAGSLYGFTLTTSTPDARQRGPKPVIEIDRGAAQPAPGTEGEGSPGQPAA